MHLLAIGLTLAGVAWVAHWWNASAVLRGRQLECTNFLGRVYRRGAVRWASVNDEANPRHRRILCTLDNGAFVTIDGEWLRAKAFWQALRDAGVASQSWPERRWL